MCELFFAYKINGEIDAESMKELLKSAVGGAEINKDGFGVFNDKRRVFKRPKKYGEQYYNPILKKFQHSKFIVLHLRNATSGCVMKKNTHPFEYKGHILAHNGMLYGYNQWEKAKDDTCDSYELLKEIVDSKQENTVKKIKHIGETISAMLSVFLYDKNKNLFYFKDDSTSFSFGYCPTLNMIFGATKKERLKTLFKRTRLNFFTYSKYNIVYGTPKEDKVYLISDAGINPIARFTPKTNYVSWKTIDDRIEKSESQTHVESYGRKNYYNKWDEEYWARADKYI